VKPAGRGTVPTQVCIIIAPSDRGADASFSEEQPMHEHNRDTRTYAPPRLKVYGTVADITLTINDNKNKNDSQQGTNNLKT
jgi:hypothetical protein